MLRIVMPIYKDKLSEHFGHAEKFMFFDIDEQKKILTTEIISAPEHFEGSFPQWIKSQNANVVIVTGIGPKAIDIFKSFSIDVITNVIPDNPRKIIGDFLNNKLNRTYEEVCDHAEHHH